MNSDLGIFLLKKCENNSIDCVECTAKIIAKHYVFLERFSHTFGMELFKNLQTCQRIRFLYDNIHKIKNPCKKVDVSCRDHTVCLADRSSDFGRLNVMLLQNLEPNQSNFSIRAFSDNGNFSQFLSSHWTDENKQPTFKLISGITTKENGQNHYHVLEEDFLFWNFSETNNTNNANQRSDGFLDIINTKRVAQLVEFTSNSYGFNTKIKRIFKIMEVNKN